MLYPLAVSFLLILGQDEIPTISKGTESLAKSIYEVLLFSKKNGSRDLSDSVVKNYKQFLFNTSTQKYSRKRCGLQRSEIKLRKAEDDTDNKPEDNKTGIVSKYDTMHRFLSKYANSQNINDFLFLCQIYNLEMYGTNGYDTKYEYRQIRDRFDCSSNSADAKLFDRALIIAAFAADGAKELTETENTSANKTVADKKKEFAEKQSKAAKIANDIREKRKSSQRPKGSIYYANLLSVLDKFLEQKSISHTLSDLLKLTIIDPESLDVWSGKESSHFLDNIGDEMYTLAMAPEFFFGHNGHEQYINNLRFVAVNPSETHFCYVDNQLGKYSDDIPEFITELLHFTYKELLAHYDVDDSKRKLLVNARNYIGTLTPSQSLDDNERPARRYLLMEMFIRLVSAVLTNNWEDIELIPTRSFPELIQATDSFISRINISELNKFLHSESADDSVLTNALAMYEEAGRLITSNEILLKWFDERYSKQFLALISSSQAQNRLFAEGSSYPNIFSLYRRWLARKKAYIYTCYKEISLRSDIISMKICNDYMKLYREDKSAILPFTVIDNSEVSRRFRLRQASIDDFKEVKQMNDKEFSRKVFVKSPDKELEFGINNGTIWLVEDESTDTMVAFFIIVPIENNERLAQMKGVYGTATLAHEYAIENNCIDKPFVIFDAVIVDPKYRGLGFQRLGLLLAEYLGKEISAEFICATVSPANIPSSRNFQLLDYKKLQTVYYPSSDTLDTPGRRYEEPTKYYTNHTSECDNEEISPEILSFLRENHISDEDYKQERIAVRDFVVFNIAH